MYGPVISRLLSPKPSTNINYPTVLFFGIIVHTLNQSAT